MKWFLVLLVLISGCTQVQPKKVYHGDVLTKQDKAELDELLKRL